MRYNLYFHNDFDGRASAALMLVFLLARGDRVDRYVPVDHGEIPEWTNDDFFKKGNPAIVLDFPYHPGAAWWFDHHPTTFKKKTWEKKFREDAQHRLNTSCRSACHVVYEALKENFGWKPPAHLEELVKWADIIDSAHYASAQQTIEIKEPALQIAMFADSGSRSKRDARWLVELLATRPLSVIAREPKIKKLTAEFRGMMKEGVSFAKKNTELSGRVVYLDLSRQDFHKIKEGLRYLPFVVYPKAPYGLRFMKNRKFHVGVGVNPWHQPKNGVDIGRLLKKYGGGGHYKVGGAEFETRADAARAVREIIATING